MKDLIGANWLILTPIIILSIAAVAVIIERIVYFFRIRPGSGVILTEALSKIGKYTTGQIIEQFPVHNSSPAKELLGFALTTRIRAVPQLYKQRLEALRDRHLDRMERNLPILSGIGNVATLMGLFGTVSGMITAFSIMNETGNSDPYVLAGGISQALVTTAAGLAVAIPAMLAHHLFEAVVDRHAEQMEEVVTECLSISGAQYARKKESKTSQA
jgi:biopolymer transport protein ExbB